jgi:hypothetical protein
MLELELAMTHRHQLSSPVGRAVLSSTQATDNEASHALTIVACSVAGSTAHRARHEPVLATQHAIEPLSTSCRCSPQPVQTPTSRRATPSAPALGAPALVRALRRERRRSRAGAQDAAVGTPALLPPGAWLPVVHAWPLCAAARWRCYAMAGGRAAQTLVWGTTSRVLVPLGVQGARRHHGRSKSVDGCSRAPNHADAAECRVSQLPFLRPLQPP